jgi:hypothetical protein
MLLQAGAIIVHGEVGPENKINKPEKDMMKFIFEKPVHASWLSKQVIQFSK